MISYLPAIYPDELVYSWFCRFYVHMGYKSHTEALRELYVKRSDVPSKEFVGNLNNSARAAVTQMYPMEKLLMEHTMLPQYIRFLSPERKKHAFDTLLSGHVDYHQIVSVPQKRTEDRCLKYCPECVNADRKCYGETYWHRTHQLRGLIICPIHHCMLCQSEVPATSEQCYTFSPAEDYVHDIPAAYTLDDRFIRFSDYLVKAFHEPFDFRYSIPVSAVLYSYLENTRYLKKTRKVRNIQMLADDMNAYYSEIGLKDSVSIYLLHRILSGQYCEFYSVCLVGFFLGIDNITGEILTEEQQLASQEAYHERKPCPDNWTNYDHEMVPEIEEFCVKRRIVSGISDGLFLADVVS